MKSSRRRSSGTRQAFVSQENIYSVGLLRGLLGLGLGFAGRLGLGGRLLRLVGRPGAQARPCGGASSRSRGGRSAVTEPPACLDLLARGLREAYAR